MKARVLELLSIDPSNFGNNVYQVIVDMLNDELDHDRIIYLFAFLERACHYIQDTKIKLDYCTLIVSRLGHKGFLY